MYKYNVWCLMEVINYCHKEILPSWKLQSFVNMDCRVDFAEVVLALVLLNYHNEFALIFMWYSLSCSIRKLENKGFYT